MVHQRLHNVTTTVLLPGDGWMYRRMSGNDEAWNHVRKHPDEIVTFCNVDPEREDAVQVLQKHLGKGALGIGEQKFELDADSPQMRQVYDVAQDYGVPVLLHFGSKHNHGFERFHTGYSRLILRHLVEQYQPGWETEGSGPKRWPE